MQNKVLLTMFGLKYDCSGVNIDYFFNLMLQKIVMKKITKSQRWKSQWFATEIIKLSDIPWSYKELFPLNYQCHTVEVKIRHWTKVHNALKWKNEVFEAKLLVTIMFLLTTNISILKSVGVYWIPSETSSTPIFHWIPFGLDYHLFHLRNFRAMG